jgi:hypothetical protein
LKMRMQDVIGTLQSHETQSFLLFFFSKHEYMRLCKKWALLSL